MKLPLLILCFLALFKSSAQDTLKINHFVSEINSLRLPLKTDSVEINQPNLNILTLISTLIDKGEVIKCIYHVTADKVEKGVTKRSIGITNYYYRNNEIIKVEIYKLEKGKEHRSEWYYSEEKPIYYTEKSTNAEIMAIDLLDASRAIRKKATEGETKK